MAYNKTSNNKQLTHEIVGLVFSDVRKSFLAAIAVAAIQLPIAVKTGFRPCIG